MTKFNAKNERLKHEYLGYLRDARGQDESSVDAAAKALARFEEVTKLKDFGQFHFQQAVAFKRHLQAQKNQRGTGLLSKSTLHATLGHVKTFFTWLAGQPGYRSKLTHSDITYFTLSGKDTRVATARREGVGPTLEQVKHVLGLMPTGTDMEKRDRALMAFTLMTGARDSATVSFKLRHLNLAAGSVSQDARDVKTKFSKSFTTVFLPVGADVKQIVADWVNHLRMELLWGDDDPLFPATLVQVGATRRFEVVGLQRAHWKSAAAVRKMFREAFVRAGLPYFNPHSFRNTLVRLGMSVCKGDPELLKAWSQNIGHDKVLTTLMSYGAVSFDRQSEIIRGLGVAKPEAPAHMAEVLKLLQGLVAQQGKPDLPGAGAGAA